MGAVLAVALIGGISVAILPRHAPVPALTLISKAETQV